MPMITKYVDLLLIDTNGNQTYIWIFLFFKLMVIDESNVNKTTIIKKDFWYAARTLSHSLLEIIYWKTR